MTILIGMRRQCECVGVLTPYMPSERQPKASSVEAIVDCAWRLRDIGVLPAIAILDLILYQYSIKVISVGMPAEIFDSLRCSTPRMMICSRMLFIWRDVA